MGRTVEWFGGGSERLSGCGGRHGARSTRERLRGGSFQRFLNLRSGWCWGKARFLRGVW